jgi:acyl dehydratase
MAINYDDLMSRRADGVKVSYSDQQVLLYNLSIGMGRDPLDEKELPFVFEKPVLRVVPTFATTLLGGGFAVLGGTGLNVQMILHGEERLTIHRPFPAAADLTASIWISEIVDKGADKGALITVTSEACLATGEPLFTTDHLIFARGDGGFGGPSQSGFTPHSLPARVPDIVHVTETRPDQALLYRLNGDRNPLHAQPDQAKRAGFPRPILHGLGSYGIACRAILATVCDYDIARIKRFDARFTSPVYPGETIHTDIWVDGEEISYRSRVEARGVTLLNNGRCVAAA